MWHLFFMGVYRENHKCEARALRSRAIFEDINVDVQNTRSPSLLGGSGTFYVTDMTKSSGYRMNCEAIYAISAAASNYKCEAERFSKIQRIPLTLPQKPLKLISNTPKKEVSL